MTAGEFLDWRQKRGITRADAAQLLCVAPTQVWRWEQGHRIPPDTALLCWLMMNDGVFEAIKKRLRFMPHRPGKKNRA